MTTATRRSGAPRGWTRPIAVIASVAFLAAACGSSKGSSSTSTDAVGAAQARVAAAETSEANAQKALTDANQQFCVAGKDYVSALDRYGKIFDDTKATVGDVKTAGADLPAPRKTVESAIDDVSTARSELERAQKDLADANVALAAAKSTASSTPTSPSTENPKTTTTIVAAATVDRVKQAESDFTKNTSTITDDTPIAKAGVIFNSAAFALEAVWVQLLAQAGCISDEQLAPAIAKVQEYTAALQHDLQVAGYYSGKIDAIYGPETVAAVEKLQTDNGLPATGLVDQATALALDEKVNSIAANSATETAGLQSVLKVAGYWSGPVDGKWTPELTDALKELQTALGVPASGVVDPATLSALETTVSTAKESSRTTTPTSTTSTAGG